MLGALGGVLFWGILESGLSIMQASPYSINVFRGGFCFVAMMLDALKTQYLRTLSAHQVVRPIDDRNSGFEQPGVGEKREKSLWKPQCQQQLSHCAA